MSSFTLYDASIGVAKDALNSLYNILKKAESHANAASLPTARLYEDMLPLSFQVHMVTDTAQKIVARTTGVEPLELDRNMETLEAMQKRIAQVQEIVEKADKETIINRAGETVTLGLGPGKTAQLKSSEYVQGYGVPNLYFHLTTAYAILRNQGVPLGKTDYLGSFLGKFVSN